MLEFDQIQEAGRRTAFKRAKRGEPRPGHERGRGQERTPEKRSLLVRAVKDVYRRTPPRLEAVDGVEMLALPWRL